MRFLWAFMALISQAFVVETQNSTLKLVQVVFRHGDRAPTKDYPTDPNTVNWPDGLSQLTTIGMQQEYELGTWLAARYGDFLDKRYSRRDVFYRSDDVDRTLQSAAAQLAGLYPPLDSQKFNPSLNWQPIPIHATEVEIDSLLYDPTCPNYDQQFDDVLMSKDVQDIVRDDVALFEYISQNAGMEINVTNFDKVYDPAFCERTHNMTQPQWYNDTVFERVKQLKVLDWHWRFYNRSLTRLRSGVLVDALIKNMQAVQNDVTLTGGKPSCDNKQLLGVEFQNVSRSSLKFIGYSGHDSNLVGLLHGMNVWNDRSPTYASCILLELSYAFAQDGGCNRWVVSVFLRNASQSDAFRLAIPGCADPCPLERFQELLDDVRVAPENWRAECGLEVALAQSQTSSTTDSKPKEQSIELLRESDFYTLTIVVTPALWWIIIVIIVLIVVFLLSFISYIVYKVCKKNKKQKLLTSDTIYPYYNSNTFDSNRLVRNTDKEDSYNDYT